jgi:hypothetical protein
LIVANSLRWSSAAELEQTRRSLRAALGQWQTSMHNGDLQAYLAMYSDDFRHLGMTKAEWGAYRMQVFASRPPPRISIDNLMLLADPFEADVYLSRFTQMIDSGNGSLTAWKRLYWRRLPGDRFEIVSEDAG